MSNEIEKRIKFLTEDLEKRKKKVEFELQQLKKIYLELVELKDKVEVNAK